MKTTYPVLTVTQAQTKFPKLCREGKSFFITKRAKPISVLLPINAYEALMETINLLSNAKAMKTLRAARKGKLRFKNLDLDHEDFGL